MPSQRKHEKVDDLLRDLAGDFINRQSNRISLITPTRVVTSNDFGKATIFVSVFPDSEEENALNFLKRARSELRDYLKEHSKLRIVPFVDFEIDLGENNRQQVEDISSR